jgi:hypothetical protein
MACRCRSRPASRTMSRHSHGAHQKGSAHGFEGMGEALAILEKSLLASGAKRSATPGPRRSKSPASTPGF